MLELLSPAGSPEAVVAAVQSGADAVYLGLGGFNARRGAKNFTEQEFIDAARYCRARGCKVYAALNTLVADRELPELMRLGRFVSENGADAVLVQDLGAARVLREVCPDLPLHASTQMSVHNLAGVYAARDLGMKRVVLARELSLEQIKYIAARSPIEIEVFVHGALCFCYSGQCYMSALIGRRSGNRGACAQPCRLRYSMGRMADNYPLSLKDNCLVQHLGALDEAGVACVKIEGRMRRPEYTAIVTEIYSHAVHGIAPSERDLRRLEAAFSREGFTDGYFTGEHGAEMFGTAGEPDPDAKKLYNEARKKYASGETRRVDAAFHITVHLGRPVELTAADGEGAVVTVYGPAPEKAETTPLTKSALSEQLYKTGGTPYRCRGVVSVLGDGLYLPPAAINALRRRALEALTEKRAELPQRRYGAAPRPVRPLPTPAVPELRVQVLTAEQLTPELAAPDYSALCAPLELLASAPERFEPFRAAGKTICAVLPRVISDAQFPEIAEMMKSAREAGASEALVGNLGHIALARSAFECVRGDFGLNAFNSYALEELSRAGLRSAAVSFELRLAQIRDMAKSIETELIVYGRLPLMVSEQCIIKRSSGECTCSAPAALSDRMGSVFPVVREFGCRNVVYNAHKLFMADRANDLLSAGAGIWRLMFTTESPRECCEITKAYLGQSAYRPNGLTRGLYYRGVE